MDAAELVKPGRDDASSEHRAMRGSLQLARGLTAARDYDFGTAWRFWDMADDIARSLGEDYWHSWNGFGPVDMQLNGVSIDVALGRYGDAARRAENIEIASIPSVPDRSWYSIEVARGYLARRDDVAAYHLLSRAYQESPEMVLPHPAPPPTGRSATGSGQRENHRGSHGSRTRKLRTRRSASVLHQARSGSDRTITTVSSAVR
jgi:hypothetical protein